MLNFNSRGKPWKKQVSATAPALNVSHLHLAPPTKCEFCRDFRRQKTRISGLSCGVLCVILRLAVLVEHWRVTDRWKDGQTDKQRQQIAKLAIVARVKNKFNQVLNCWCSCTHPLQRSRPKLGTWEWTCSVFYSCQMSTSLVHNVANAGWNTIKRPKTWTKFWTLNAPVPTSFTMANVTLITIGQKMQDLTKCWPGVFLHPSIHWSDQIWHAQVDQQRIHFSHAKFHLYRLSETSCTVRKPKCHHMFTRNKAERGCQLKCFLYPKISKSSNGLTIIPLAQTLSFGRQTSDSVSFTGL